MDSAQDDKVPKELRKKLRFLYALKMGVPEVGLGVLSWTVWPETIYHICKLYMNIS